MNHNQIIAPSGGFCGFPTWQEIPNKAAWPTLDPYACRDDFDAWLEKVPGRQPRQYDRAFLGFAKKWAIGKT
jgi:hypothetical protein